MASYRDLPFRWLFLFTFLTLTVGCVLWILINRLDFEAPAIHTKDLGEAIREKRHFSIEVTDGGGLRSVTATLSAGSRSVTLLERQYPSRFLSGGSSKTERFELEIDPAALSLPEGDAALRVVATDHSWRNWFSGNACQYEKRLLIDVTPPKITVLSDQHNLTPGGAGMVTYRVSEPCPRHGVMVGERFYKGYAATDVLGPSAGADLFLCLFAIAHDQPREVPLIVTADDQAGNHASASFYHYVRGVRFKEDTLAISDDFIKTHIAKLAISSTGKPESDFLSVNRDLRKANMERFEEICQSSDARVHWSGPFLRMPNAAPRAGFGDRRTYTYNNAVIDHQIHLGVDLASLAQAPVPAANAGRVAFTGDVGIFGLTVVLDHGLGLFSAYSHLTDIQVSPDTQVKKGDIVGHTGTTGLAVGDHLHYAMIVGQIFVNPLEWWDEAWIRNNIQPKLAAAGGR